MLHLCFIPSPARFWGFGLWLLGALGGTTTRAFAGPQGSRGGRRGGVVRACYFCNHQTVVSFRLLPLEPSAFFLFSPLKQFQSILPSTRDQHGELGTTSSIQVSTVKEWECRTRSESETVAILRGAPIIMLMRLIRWRSDGAIG